VTTSDPPSEEIEERDDECIRAVGGQRRGARTLALIFRRSGIFPEDLFIFPPPVRALYGSCAGVVSGRRFAPRPHFGTWQSQAVEASAIPAAQPAEADSETEGCR
jgi:hypothetical protein